MLRTSGKDFVNEKGEKITLRGQNIGIWGIIEPQMFGTPGVEHRLLRAMRIHAGEEKTNRFFRGVLTKWLTEPDIAFLKEIGCNSIRLPFSYRRLEDDAAPFEYKEEIFKMMDNVISWCAKREMYVILDMHVVQGYQMGDFCGDNLFEEHSYLYYDGMAQKRYLELWKVVAERYKNETWVGGYDLMNEPVAKDRYEVAMLNKLYRQATEAIRAIDPHHIIFIGGNTWNQDFDEMDSPFTDNLAYTPHYYCISAVRPGQYPGADPDSGEWCDLEAMKVEFTKRDRFMEKHNVPCWIGEFGARRYDDIEGKHRALRDYFTVINERGHSWSYWCFKDLSFRGPLYVSPDSPWCEFIKDMEKLKEKYKTDRGTAFGEGWDISSVFSDYQPDDFVWDRKTVEDHLIRNMRETLSDMLTMTFAKKFATLSNEKIDALTDSFLFENCAKYEPWIEIFKEVSKYEEEK